MPSFLPERGGGSRSSHRFLHGYGQSKISSQTGGKIDRTSSIPYCAGSKAIPDTHPLRSLRPILGSSHPQPALLLVWVTRAWCAVSGEMGEDHLTPRFYYRLSRVTSLGSELRSGKWALCCQNKAGCPFHHPWRLSLHAGISNSFSHGSLSLSVTEPKQLCCLISSSASRFITAPWEEPWVCWKEPKNGKLLLGKQFLK